MGEVYSAILRTRSAGRLPESSLNAPFDVESSDAWLLGQDASDERVDVLRGIWRYEPFRSGIVFEGRVEAGLERGVAVLGVDVVAYPDELLLGVRAREEDDGHADEVARRNPGRQRRGGLARWSAPPDQARPSPTHLELEAVHSDGDWADHARVELLVERFALSRDRKSVV